MLLFGGFAPMFSLKIAFFYALAKLEFTHSFLPNSLRDKLPKGWSYPMFWIAFRSGGTKIYNDYYSELQDPASYEPKVSVKPEYQLSESDIKFFYNNGYIGPFDLIPPDQAEKFREHLVNSILATQSRTWKHEFQDSTGLADELFPEEKEELSEKKKEYILAQVNKTDRHFDDKQLLNLFKHPAISERCAQLLGPDLLLWRSDCFEVPAYEEGTPWHQSSNWLLHNMREKVVNPSDQEELFQVTCWIALTDANKEKGCMKLIPGTHKKIYPLHVVRDSSQTNQMYRYDKGSIDYPFDSATIEEIEVKQGQFFIFSERVIHGSVPNSTNSPRWAINCRIAKTDTRFFTQRMIEDGHQISYQKLKNVSLDKWKAVLIRGEDRFGYNKLLEE